MKKRMIWALIGGAILGSLPDGKRHCFAELCSVLRFHSHTIVLQDLAIISALLPVSFTECF